MDRPEEKQESLQGDDPGEGSADPASAGSPELKNKTDKSPDPETLLEGEPEGDSVPEATIIPEDATPPKGPSEPEKNLEEGKPLTEGSIDIEAKPFQKSNRNISDVFFWDSQIRRYESTPLQYNRPSPSSKLP